jgi:DNA primase
MDTEIEDIKRRIDIIEFIGSYVTLKKAGTNYKGLCPFHNEKTPSMMVSPEKQIFKCFGCNEGGDVFSFLMKVEGLSFGDAIKILADKAGVKLQPRHFDRLSVGEKPGQKSRMLELQQLATRLYQKILLEHPSGKEALEYLEGRGITRETISEFKLGYAPSSWDLLIRFAESRGFTEQELLTSGLTVRKTQNVSGGNRISYDRFRERIVFPINNVLGQTVAFTGRLIKDKADAPKYLNSSESPIYQKSQIMYGLDKAKLAIKQADLVVSVEGNMDVVACHQAGFKNVVAVSGTALTKDMLLILSRYTFNIAFSFDSDNAGKLALKRAVGLAGELDLNTKVIALPEEFKDPDEAIKADPKNWEKAVEASMPALEHLINIATRDAVDIGQKKQVIKEIMPTIKLLKSKTEQEHFLKMLSMKLVVGEQTLIDTLKTVSTPKDAADTPIEKPVQMIDELKVLAILMEKPEALGEQYEATIISLSRCEILPEALREKLHSIKPLKLQELLKSSKLKDKLKEVYFGVTKDLEEEVAVENVAKELANKIRQKDYEGKKNGLISQIAAAEGEENKQKRLELLKELNSVIIGNRNKPTQISSTDS